MFPYWFLSLRKTHLGYCHLKTHSLRFPSYCQFSTSPQSWVLLSISLHSSPDSSNNCETCSFVNYLLFLSLWINKDIFWILKCVQWKPKNHGTGEGEVKTTKNAVSRLPLYFLERWYNSNDSFHNYIILHDSIIFLFSYYFGFFLNVVGNNWSVKTK